MLLLVNIFYIIKLKRNNYHFLGIFHFYLQVVIN